MERQGDGTYSLSDDELFLLRQALFVVLHHTTPAVREDLHIYTGHDYEDFQALLPRVDEVLGDHGI